MKPIEFEGQTTLLGPPQRGMKRGECGALPVVVHHKGTQQIFCSYWKPSPEDLVALAGGAQIRLAVYGGGHPPVWLDVDQVVELP